MELELLFKRIKKDGTNYKFRKGKHHLYIKDKILSGMSIKTLIEGMKVVLSLPKYRVVIEIYSKEIADDAVIQQLEMVIAHTFENGVDFIELNFDSILESSPYIVPLKQSVFARNKFKDNRCVLKKDEYLIDYYKESYSDVNYFRYYVKKESRDGLINTILMNAITFFKVNIKDEEYATSLAKAFTEIVDNVRHANSDCIATVKYSNSLVSRSDNKRVKGYFINVNDVSEVCIFEPLKYAIINHEIKGKTKDIIEKSYPFHKKYFDTNSYSLDKYCFISVFQNALTTSSNSGVTGGKGLTDLITTITTGSLMHNCYALSGDYVLFFKRDYTLIDYNGNISFNNYGSYYESLPSSESFGRSAFYYPGTIFLLEIIVEDEK